MSAHAGDEQDPRLDSPSCASRKCGMTPPVVMSPAEDRAGHHRDAADVGERDELQRDEDAEPSTFTFVNA